ncbi:homodimeric dihydroxyacetone kinase [Mycolicibacterium neoaurum]|uniref:dihydroxyacetone kinase subunit DhaK n=1 Tax=Mycolicibacterium neoaurum TaxID=1795 RepID=UPI00068EBA79|nr:dihydroxyacetone kinase subunit DhaK [Mycolicibacterium neoaurum]SDE50703.1 homodimeric dihydroxyacetone kinase [Mycolicibacterium neoaurum]
MGTNFYSAVPSASGHALSALAATGGTRVGVHLDPVYAWARDPDPARRVGLVSGGGAGHEPMHAGFLGRGGLDAVCPGEVFTSPHNRQIHAASAKVAGDGGVLHIVKNYTGDVLNFAIAAERLRADGIEVDRVLVDDDLGSQGQEVGRRGTGATVVVEKILGAAADRGLSLAELVELGQAVVASSRSLAVAQRACTPPGADRPAFDVAAGTLEYGVGIHGEAARESIARPELDALVTRMVGELLDDLDITDAGVVVLVNGLGGTGDLELWHVLAEVTRALADRGVPLRSAVSGTFVSALDMAGFSITVTAVEDEQWLQDWCAPHRTAALPSPVPADITITGDQARQPPGEPSPWLGRLADDVARIREPLNDLDRRAGDGDIGTNLDNALRAAVRRGAGADADLTADLHALATAFAEDVGGSSGPLFGLVLGRVAASVHTKGTASPADAAAEGLRDGVAAITRAGGARVGDRTMVDALHPAGWDGETPRGALDDDALTAALDGAVATSSMVGKRGRSSYVGDKAIGTTDPGALAVVVVLTAIVERIDGRRRDAVRDRLAELIEG